MKLLLVGHGRMGSALLRGWLDPAPEATGLLCSELTVKVVTPHAKYHNGRCARVQFYSTPSQISDDFDPEVLVLAVKPQIMPSILLAYRRFFEAGALTISVAAGKSLTWFERQWGAPFAMVRAMPNTPAVIGCGMTVCCANSQVLESQRTVCEGLFRAVGRVAWLVDEDHMDAVTALSGSGPAYVFWLMEVLARSGLEAGLPEALAIQITRATIEGSALLAHRYPDQTAESLRQSVTSPGGTTAAALEVLMDQRMQVLFDQAIGAAIARAREL